MKSNEILQALNLTKSKETTMYCTKLAMLFDFFKLVKDTIVKVDVLETNLTIDSNGKLIKDITVETNFKESKLNHYRWNDKKVLSHVSIDSGLQSELCRVMELLWKKRKNKDNSELESKREVLNNEREANEKAKDLLLIAEKERLSTIVTDLPEMRTELNLLTGCKISLETNNGNYCFYLPVDNKFYYEVCRMLNIGFVVKGAVKKEVKHRWVMFANVFDAIKKASKFVSNDDLRPAMQCVCLDFSKDGLQVAATDAHKLYASKHFEVEYNTTNLQLLIAPESVSKLNKVKANYDKPLEITLFNDNTATLNDLEVNVLDSARYPDYKAVMPVYEHSMVFNKSIFIDCIKKVLPYSNKATSQVNLHLNGSIALHTQDVDFGYECDAEMPYISKQFADTDIAFNGKMLVEVLSSFKENELKFKSNGISTKAGIFTNDTDTVLLMPLMINC
jgi:hypothetical protein